eukprot:GHVP01051021.1.p1 GENE.GHVP01051021.1~~GHVP01051021.1.p1  ORF type:complete len:104 (-),score=15.97 GHVP01051021.1:738-1049(-)
MTSFRFSQENNYHLDEARNQLEILYPNHTKEELIPLIQKVSAAFGAKDLLLPFYYKDTYSNYKGNSNNNKSNQRQNSNNFNRNNFLPKRNNPGQDFPKTYPNQ